MVESGSDLDFIRPGIALFGAPPSEYLRNCPVILLFLLSSSFFFLFPFFFFGSSNLGLFLHNSFSSQVMTRKL